MIVETLFGAALFGLYYSVQGDAEMIVGSAPNDWAAAGFVPEVLAAEGSIVLLVFGRPNSSERAAVPVVVTQPMGGGIMLGRVFYPAGVAPELARRPWGPEQGHVVWFTLRDVLAITGGK